MKCQNAFYHKSNTDMVSHQIAWVSRLLHLYIVINVGDIGHYTYLITSFTFFMVIWSKYGISSVEYHEYAFVCYSVRMLHFGMFYVISLLLLQIL